MPRPQPNLVFVSRAFPMGSANHQMDVETYVISPWSVYASRLFDTQLSRCRLRRTIGRIIDDDDAAQDVSSHVGDGDME